VTPRGGPRADKRKKLGKRVPELSRGKMGLEKRSFRPAKDFLHGERKNAEKKI